MLATSDDDDVRIHAANAACNFAGFEDLALELQRIALGGSEDTVLRWNAMNALGSQGRTDRVVATSRSLLNDEDDDIKQLAKKILED